ncbi:MAG: GNAT family N-acetyltransferase [Vicinamibacterales bacterium]
MTVPSVVNIQPASTPEHYETARVLFLEYQAQLGIDLCFQGFTEELARLPEMYGPPAGCLYLAQTGGRPIGCVGVRALAGDARASEMKRLYVRPEGRGCGAGRALATASIDAAREMGYSRMMLDTLGSMVAARALYSEFGFRETTPYYRNPIQGVTYLELAL